MGNSHVRQKKKMWVCYKRSRCFDALENAPLTDKCSTRGTERERDAVLLIAMHWYNGKMIAKIYNGNYLILNK